MSLAIPSSLIDNVTNGALTPAILNSTRPTGPNPSHPFLHIPPTLFLRRYVANVYNPSLPSPTPSNPPLHPLFPLFPTLPPSPLSSQEATKEELRRQHQAELAKQKIEETARRLAAGGLGATGGQGVKKTMGDLVSYTSVDDVPVPVREIAIQVRGEGRQGWREQSPY